jgi:hypothetical protein
MENELITKWTSRIGIGFDPLCFAKDYAPPMTGQEAKEYDSDMNTLWDEYGTMGELEGAILDEMQKQGLVP